MGLRAIGLTHGFYSLLAGLLSGDLGRLDATAPDRLAGLRAVHAADYSSRSKARQCH
jgi:hypothetical protein